MSLRELATEAERPARPHHPADDAYFETLDRLGSCETVEEGMIVYGTILHATDEEAASGADPRQSRLRQIAERDAWNCWITEHRARARRGDNAAA